jgi:hypothetical protein
MIVNGTEIIREQLEATEKHLVKLDAKHSTEITPVQLTPVPVDGKVSLNGIWEVKYYPFEEAEAASPEPDASWRKVPQPGKVFYADPLAEGKDIPNWDRVKLTHINECDGAILTRKIAVSEAWSGKKIFLRFDAIYPAGSVFCNGKKLGDHYSGLTPFEADVTALVTPGKEATVTVRLLRKHKFVKMDMPRHSLEFAGISQHAYLFAVEPVYLSEYHLITELDETFTIGSLVGKVTVANPATETLTVLLLDGNTVVTETAVEIISGTSEYTVGLTVDAPKLWNDEFPNLYTVQLILGSNVYEYRTGFRRLDLSLEGPKLNGRFIKFRGVNHLTFHPEYGMYTPKDWLRRNLALMKKANVNAIRTHFTGSTDFVDLCDEMGIYLLQELPIDWGLNYIHDPEWVGPALMRLEAAIRRDRHHPSVMVWSVGNENIPESAAVSTDGWNHLSIYDEFCHLLDPSRPTMFPPPGPANKIKGIFELRVGDIADTHYSFTLQKEMRDNGKIMTPNSWEADMVEITREQALERGWSGCWFSSEYGIFNCVPDVLNGPYLSVIADEQVDPLSRRNSMEVFAQRLRNEWGNMRHDPTCLGGAYFPWLCGGVGIGAEGNPWGWTRWGEDANWGVITADLLPKPYFWALRVLFAPVWFPERVTWKSGEDHISFKIDNHYNSINLKNCTFRTQQNAGGSWISMLRQFRDIKVECVPGGTVEVKIPIWRQQLRDALDAGNWGLCRVTMLAPDGFCPVTADILVVPEVLEAKDDIAMPIGPDAVL